MPGWDVSAGRSLLISSRFKPSLTAGACQPFFRFSLTFEARDVLLLLAGEGSHNMPVTTYLERSRLKCDLAGRFGHAWQYVRLPSQSPAGSGAALFKGTTTRRCALLVIGRKYKLFCRSKCGACRAYRHSAWRYYYTLKAGSRSEYRQSAAIAMTTPYLPSM
jgi:hypothetical protein